jgi:hypothetical protein
MTITDQGIAIVEVVDAPLTTAEAADLARHEATIDRGLDTYIAVGEALMAIRDQRLYRQTHRGFDAYVRERWPQFQTRRQADRLIAAASVAADLRPIGLTVANESQARVLAPLAPEERRQAMQAATAANPNGQPTAKQISAAVQAIRPAQEPGAWFWGQSHAESLEAHQWRLIAPGRWESRCGKLATAMLPAATVSRRCSACQAAIQSTAPEPACAIEGCGETATVKPGTPKGSGRCKSCQAGEASGTQRVGELCDADGCLEQAAGKRNIAGLSIWRCAEHERQALAEQAEDERRAAVRRPPPDLSPVQAVTQAVDQELRKLLVAKYYLLQHTLDLVAEELRTSATAEMLAITIREDAAIAAARSFLNSPGLGEAAAMLAFSAVAEPPPERIPIKPGAGSLLAQIEDLEAAGAQADPAALRVAKHELDDLVELLDDATYQDAASRLSAVAARIREAS